LWGCCEKLVYGSFLFKNWLPHFTLTQGASTCAFKNKETKLAPSPLLLLGCLVLSKTCVSSSTPQEHVQKQDKFLHGAARSASLQFNINITIFSQQSVKH